MKMKFGKKMNSDWKKMNVYIFYFIFCSFLTSDLLKHSKNDVVFNKV